MKDNEGNNTRTGLAQFEAVKEQVLLQDVRVQIGALTFDTTGSNTGAHVGLQVPVNMSRSGLVILFRGSDVNITFDFFKELWDSLGKNQLVTPLPGAR